MSDAPSIVALKLESVAENLTLVRGMLAGVAELLSMDPELLDDLKTAVSEAANNVVMHAYRGESGPMRVNVKVSGDDLELLVRDEGVGMPELAALDDRLQGVGIPVMRALAREVSFERGEAGGTVVRMLFATERDGKSLLGSRAVVAPEDGWTEKLSGDAIVSLSPVTLLSSVLGRLARALAASARFSLDRFSDVYLVTDSIAAHAQRSAASERVGFSLQAGRKRLELTVGPFAPGSIQELTSDHGGGSRSPLVLLSDEITSEPQGGDSECLRVVVLDRGS